MAAAVWRFLLLALFIVGFFLFFAPRDDGVASGYLIALGNVHVKAQAVKGAVDSLWREFVGRQAAVQHGEGFGLHALMVAHVGFGGEFLHETLPHGADEGGRGGGDIVLYLLKAGPGDIAQHGGDSIMQLFVVLGGTALAVFIRWRAERAAVHAGGPVVLTLDVLGL